MYSLKINPIDIIILYFEKTEGRFCFGKIIALEHNLFQVTQLRLLLKEFHYSTAVENARLT